jgi:circadian clock protein KaiC
MSSTLVQAACRRGEKVLYLSFEESREAMVNAMQSAGVDLRPSIKNKRLLVQTALPEAMGSDDHLIRALDAIDTFKPNHVVLDAVSACVRMGSEQAAFDYLMRLVSVLKDRAITCIMTNQITGLAGSDEELSGIGFSSVVDAVIQLRFVESGDEITRQILVIKSRGSAHSNRRRPFVITSRGIEFPDNAPPLADPSRRADRNGGD